MLKSTTMTSSAATAEVWRFTTTDAWLSIGALRGHVTLTSPAAGIDKLTWNAANVVGRVLGVSAGATSAPQDAFARENDLVAVYAQSEPQEFLWQVYWRASAPAARVVVLDAILSLQTPLSESFPRVTSHTVLSVGEAAKLPGDGDIIVLRPAGCDWTYAEMTHPKDRGLLEVASVPEGHSRIVRHLGGQFLEKGVIRRLRLRGAFLPREDDFELAQHYYTELAEETPPLTA
jgi:hypothetical protein